VRKDTFQRGLRHDPTTFTGKLILDLMQDVSAILGGNRCDNLHYLDLNHIQ
jgi:hypothetical protein